jgi:hypothetical protein
MELCEASSNSGTVAPSPDADRCKRAKGVELLFTMAGAPLGFNL